MEGQTTDTLALLGSLLTLKNILALATTNKDLERKVASPGFNRQLAIHFGFPFGLSLVELKKYEAADLNLRLRAASKIGDLRVVKRLVELGASEYDKAMVLAAEGGYEDIVDFMLELGATDYDLAMAFAMGSGHQEIVEKMIKLGASRDNVTIM
jgi:hypothetical protein